MKNNTIPLQTLAIATFSVFAFFIWQGNVGFNLWDEGFLWYGVQRVMLGEVPIRDFMAYDPGRYYWSAAFMGMWGDNGIMALRFTSMIFEVIGIFVGLMLIFSSVKKQGFFYLLLSATTLLAWMIMSFKAVDYVVSIMLVGALAFLIQNPTCKRYFIAGTCVGLAAFLGRNHGVYGIIGSMGVMFFLNLKKVESDRLMHELFYCAVGGLIGFTPMIFMILFIPGFVGAFWDSIIMLFEIKATNLPLPVPWPWLVNFTSLPLGEAIHGVLLGVFFIALVVFGILSIAWVFWQKCQNKKVSSVLVAASFLALPYAQCAFSRADVYHLSLGIFPLLVGCLAVLSMQPAKFKWPLGFILCASSLWVMFPYYPGWQCHVSKQCVNIEISGSDIVVDPNTASDVGLLRKLVTQYARDGQSFIATPFWPGAYSLFERKSPMWEIYALFSRSQSFELAEVERIKAAKPGFALVFDHPLDGRDELRFQNTHPLIHQYILDNFERLPDSPNPEYKIYKAKTNTL